LIRSPDTAVYKNSLLGESNKRWATPEKTGQLNSSTNSPESGNIN